MSTETKLREALEATKCLCRKQRHYRCPQCGGDISSVPRSAYLNSEQWDSVKAGDFYCKKCKSDQCATGFKYWNSEELPEEVVRQCQRCAALALPPSVERVECRGLYEEFRGGAGWLERSRFK